METSDIATQLLARVIEQAGGKPTYVKTNRAGSAGGDRIGPDQFNKPREDNESLENVDEMDDDGGEEVSVTLSGE